MKCKLCDTRKARRHCPGVNGDICSMCCGTEREVSVACPLDCEFLAEARLHEKPPAVNPEEFPNRDIKVTEDFLRNHEHLLVFLGMRLVEAALEGGVLDSDVQEAIASLIRTYRTLQSGLYYETRPDNPLAAAVHQKVQDAIQELRKELAEKGAPSLRDAEILGVLAFLERIGLHQYNGRPRGRAYIDYLRHYFPHGSDKPANAPLLIQT